MTAPSLGSWHAELKLGFERREARTVLTERRHRGPLYLQKTLYPEGPAVCHAVVVHPPGGLAGGDELQVEANVGADAHVVLTTPAATKWYKCASAPASQSVHLRLRERAHLEWLPQENIFFRHTRATNRFTIELPETATASGWEAVVLGRHLFGECWDEGHLRFETKLIRPGGRLLWTERASFTGQSALLQSPHGLAGLRVLGTFWATSPNSLAGCAEALAPTLPFADSLRAGVTHLPGNVLLIRALAASMDTLRLAMIDWWTRLRVLIHNLPPKPLRLWAT